MRLGTLLLCGLAVGLEQVLTADQVGVIWLGSLISKDCAVRKACNRSDNGQSGAGLHREGIDQPPAAWKGKLV